MGRALVCPMCRRSEIVVEQLRYVSDLWSNLPLLAVEEMVALRCRNCRHVRIIHPSKERLSNRPLARN